MKTRILKFIKHALITLVLLASTLIVIGLSIGASAHYGDNPQAMDWDREGPYVFFQDDGRLNVNYVRGDKDEGFYLDQEIYSMDTPVPAQCYFPIDSTSFNFTIDSKISIPDSTYNDTGKILAISDIESGYRTFRDFLISNKVIDKNLTWTFGKGHLVLVGDFVDRGFSTTQVLWFVYKLEREAEKQGGHVHFIVGNHELKTMQGDYTSASPKYFHVASILGKRQMELYGADSFIGRWLASKNTIELINGHLFVHGGIHPDLADLELDLAGMNHLIRRNYYSPHYPKKDEDPYQILLSRKTGPAWYRGYFKDDLTQEDVDLGLAKFNAKSVIVGHTIQSKVNRRFDGKVIGIDVRHPKDYNKSWPKRGSEGLLIEGDTYYRVMADGEKKEI